MYIQSILSEIKMWIIEDDEWFIRDKKTTENMTRMQYLMPFISYYASSSQFEYICLKSI